MKGYEVSIDYTIAGGKPAKGKATLRTLREVAELRDLSHRYAFLIKEERFTVGIKDPFVTPNEVVDDVLLTRFAAYVAEAM